MQTTSLTALAREELAKAIAASNGRSSHTVFGGREHRLRQTLLALRAGEKLSEHRNPGEATVQVLTGRVLLRAGEASWGGSAGEMLTVPDGLHSLEAVDDAAILLTVVSRAD